MSLGTAASLSADVCNYGCVVSSPVVCKTVQLGGVRWATAGNPLLSAARKEGGRDDEQKGDSAQLTVSVCLMKYVPCCSLYPYPLSNRACKASTL